MHVLPDKTRAELRHLARVVAPGQQHVEDQEARHVVFAEDDLGADGLFDDLFRRGGVFWFAGVSCLRINIQRSIAWLT